MVINVEYNQLDPLLRATGYPDGDTNSETGYSPYPGNINQVNYIFQRDNLPYDTRSIDCSALMIWRCNANTNEFCGCCYLQCHIMCVITFHVHFVHCF
jgi:hypothetical protein